MASITKVIAALITLGTDLDEEVTVSEEAAAYAVPAYSNIGLAPGEVLSARELLMATMIFSGDAAAYALAEHVGNGNAQRFLGVMNAKAEEVGLRETGLENPVGFGGRGHHTSARDLAEVTAWRWRTRPFERWSRPSTRASPRRTGRCPLPTRTSCSSSARHRRQYRDHAGGRGDACLRRQRPDGPRRRGEALRRAPHAVPARGEDRPRRGRERGGARRREPEGRAGGQRRERSAPLRPSGHETRGGRRDGGWKKVG